MTLKCRKYREVIILRYVAFIEDAFGKSKVDITEDTLTTFASISQTNSNKAIINNSAAQETSYIFVIRYTDVLFNQVVWRGKTYTINSIENIEQKNIELVINAQRAE